MRTSLRVAALLLFAVLAGTCKEGPTGPRVGVLLVQLQSPGGDGAIMFDLAGPAAGLALQMLQPTMIDTLAADSLRVAVFAPAGASIGPGAILEFGVPDVCAAGSYRFHVVEVAGTDYTLKQTGGYVLTATPTTGGC